MTQPSRTTETINRDNAAIRDIMHQVRELTVPDRATLALGLVGHLATLMNHAQITKLMDQLREEAERVQDVPPSRRREEEEPADGGAGVTSAHDGRDNGSEKSRGAGRGGDRDDRMSSQDAARPADPERTPPAGDVLRRQVKESGREGVGQGGRGEFRSRRLL